jgi:tetratricopeptide (TPR) repeat protein
MSKLVSEADRLLDKGKVPEAIEKLKSALKEDPLNQLVATKLANAFLANDDQDSATKVYTQLANRLSEAGKAQIAIAIYKQALELSPDDIALKVKFATECEAVGKMGDALGQVNLAFQYYIRRKKYYDAANILPLMVRLQPKDEKLKLSWIEIMQLSQADQKLVHLLVALCGPPGIVSTEFSVGGDPLVLTDGMFEALKRLVPYFPRDPKIAYAVAWVAHKRGKNADFYRLLKECLRREPDFSLALLLLARVLAEKQKLNESLFVFKHMKERMPADKSVDMLTLNRLVDGFVEKNGWISFTDGMGVDEIDTEGFLAAVRGEKKAEAAGAAGAGIPSDKPEVPNAAPDLGFLDSVIATAKAEDEKKSPTPKAPGDEKPMPAGEISLEPGGAGSGEFEVEFTSAQATKAQASKPANSNVDRANALKDLDLKLDESTNSVLLTSLIGIDPSAETKDKEAKPTVPANKASSAPPSENVEQTKKGDIRAVPEIAEIEPTKPFDSTSVPSKEKERPKFTFNPFANSENINNSSATSDAAPMATGEKTELFSPLDLLGAANVLKQKVDSVETKIIVNPQLGDLRLGAQAGLGSSEAKGRPSDPPTMTQTVSEQIQGDPTALFSPLEAVDAGVSSRKSHSNSDDVATTIIVNPLISAAVPPIAPSAPEPVAVAPAEILSSAPTADVEAATQMISSPQPAIAAQTTESIMPSFTASEVSQQDPLAALANAAGEATVILTNVKPFTPETLPVAPAASESPQLNVAEVADPLSTSIQESVFQLESAAQALADATSMVQPALGDQVQSPTVSVQMNPTEVLKELNLGGASGVTTNDPDDILATLLNKNVPEIDATQVAKQSSMDPDLSSTMGTEPQASSPKPMSLGFVKIPELNANPTESVAATVSVHSENVDPNQLLQSGVDLGGVDLGDDLLDGPTRILVMPKANEATERLFNEINRDRKAGNQSEDKVAYMLKKAERFLAKRNYYLARKAYRHALELGADQQMIQNKLREIRKQEMPESLYLSESSDTGGKERSEEILRKLEQEFQLDDDHHDESNLDIEADLQHQFENILRENDPRTILDFSVGLYEMGLYRPAESLLQRFIEEYPEHSFDAFYLSAICKYTRKDYAGAVSILKKLGSDLNKTEKEKIQIYYTLGEVFEKMERHESSKEFFDKVALIDSNYRSVKQKLEK